MEYLLKCFKNADQQFKNLYDLLAYKNITLDNLKLFLKERNVPPYMISNIEKIYKVKKEARENLNKFYLLEEALKINEDEKYSSVFKKIKTIQREFDFEQNEVWKDFLNLILSMKVKNYSWTQKEMDNFFKLDVFSLVFSANRLWVKTNDENKKIHDIIKSILKTSKTFLKRDTERKIFDSKLSQIKDEQLKEYQKYSWSLDSIRSLIKDKDPLTRYIGHWKNEIGSRVSRTELFQYLDQTMNHIYLMSFNKRDIWLLEKYLPSDEMRRKTLKLKIHELMNSKSYYVRWALLQQAENELVKDWLYEKNKKFSRPLFLLKRNFYKELLESGHATEFALYNLMLLGDTNVEYLWWLCL